MDEKTPLLILLGEMKATQELQLKALDEMKSAFKDLNDRVSWVEKKVHYAIGIVSSIIFVIQYGWNYLIGKH